MKRLFIHIGIHKTGSTSLQFFLMNNRKVLLDNNFCYPEVPIDDVVPYQHRHIMSLIEKDKKDDFIQFFHDASKKADNVLISSETFLCEKYFIKWFVGLKDIFDEINIIAYLRRQDDWVESLYKWYIQYHHSRSTIFFNEFVKKFIEGNIQDLWYYDLNWFNLISHWEDAFSIDKLIIRPYDKKVLKKNSIFYDFMSILGINDLSDFSINHKLRINAGVKNINLLELMRLSNKYLNLNDRKVIFSKIEDKINPYHESLLSLSIKKKIMRSVKKSNLNLVGRYLDESCIDYFTNIKDKRTFFNFKKRSNLNTDDVKTFLKELEDEKYSELRYNVIQSYKKFL